ncbi:transcriptional regulator [Saccharopolyspora terrae]|uniref:Transcriptional regulator n=2 Tax=Saccharopolyspora terrae TaxID=2530384 RepID=A0A4R4VHT8_9PSEU|nr:transcriptional regulator [Saccharopolyspora terrae]
MNVVSSWTGRTACALQAAMRMSNDEFAAHLGIGLRTVAGWHEKPNRRPQSEMQRTLDTALAQEDDAIKARFAELVKDTADAPAEPAVDEAAAADAEKRLSADPDIGAALEWLDAHAGWTPGTARKEVATRLARLDVSELETRTSRRGHVDQRSVAEVLGKYYGANTREHGRYAARYDDAQTETSVLTCSDWLDLACPLFAAHDRLKVTSSARDVFAELDSGAAGRAAQRLAETLAMGTRLVDKPLYRLLDISPSPDAINGLVGTSRFVEYAVTMDLLEGELVDAISADATTAHESLPLRDKYLPDIASVTDVANRLCSGGPLALFAIARPASPFRGEADYVLLVQERSGNVLNAARRLAVIPKGFHQPMTDLRVDAQIGATLRREVEEELFGRDEIDNTTSEQRSADPMHPSRVSEPMRWLMEDPSRLRMECTGFGLNLLSGNFEFASLIVIDDEEFWERYGGRVEANWEAAGLHQYSSRDGDLISELIADVAWSNEGLFALLQGLRRLAQIGGDRVSLPSIEWEVR